MTALRFVEVFALSDSQPAARVEMTSDEVRDLRNLLADPDGVVELYDANVKRQVLIPARAVSTVFVYDKERT